MSSERELTDVVVIGGGVTGLAAAAELAAAGLTVCAIDRHPRFGLETSTHNSGVIHAGIYYPAGSLKAELCVDGAERLYAFCAANDVPHDRCGKFIVAAEEHERGALEALAKKGIANGVKGLEFVDLTVPAEARAARRRARRAVVAGDGSRRGGGARPGPGAPRRVARRDPASRGAAPRRRPVRPRL